MIHFAIERVPISDKKIECQKIPTREIISPEDSPRSPPKFIYNVGEPPFPTSLSGLVDRTLDLQP